MYRQATDGKRTGEEYFDLIILQSNRTIPCLIYLYNFLLAGRILGKFAVAISRKSCRV